MSDLERPPIPVRRKSSGSDSLTYLAVVGLGSVAIALLALMGAVTLGFFFLGVLGVVFGVGGISVLHYLTWGHYLTKLREREQANLDDGHSRR